jgi:hypothetical protein
VGLTIIDSRWGGEGGGSDCLPTPLSMTLVLGDWNLQDEGGMFLPNTSNHPPDYTALHPTKLVIQ